MFFVIGNEDFKWDKIMMLIQPVRLHYYGLAEILMSSSQLLTLYALALKESQNRSAYSDVLSTLVQCLEAVKPKFVFLTVHLFFYTQFSIYKNLNRILFSNIAENKLPLLWSLVLRLSTAEDDQTADYLLRVARATTQLAQHKQSWSLFDAIRLQKQTNITPKYVVVCLPCYCY